MKTIFNFLFIGIIGFSSLQAQSLQEWIALGLANSPSTASQKARITAAEKAYESAFEWPETTLGLSGIEWMPNDWSPYFRPTISLSQEIPWFKTKSIKQASARASLDLEKANASLVRIELVRQISNQYIELQYLNQQQDLVVNHQEKLQGIYENLLFKLEAGQASAWEVLLLENEMEDIKAQLQKIDFQRKAQESAFFLLVDSPRQELQLDSLRFTPAKISHEIGHHPALEELDAQQAELESSQQELQLDYAPKLSVGIHYEAAMPVEPTYLTHDMFTPQIGLRFPLLANRKKAKESRIAAQKESLKMESQARQNELNRELLQTQSSLYELETDWHTAQKNIENTEEAIYLLWSEFEAHKINYQEVARIQTQLLEKKQSQLAILKSYEQLKANLQYLITEFPKNKNP